MKKKYVLATEINCIHFDLEEGKSKPKDRRKDT
jgi:hypothetical protein